MRVWASAVVVAVAGLTTAAAAEPATKQATTRPAAATTAVGKAAPSTTPGEALERALEASFLGDEAAFRRAVRVEVPDGVAEAELRKGFAGFRLHRAVREQKVARTRVRNAGFDREFMLTVPDPEAMGMWEQTRVAVRAVKWKVEGDVAVAEELPLPANLSVRKVDGGGWLVVLGEPSAEPEHLKQFARAGKARAAAIDAATEQVIAGKLRTVGEINDYLDAAMKAAAAAAREK